MKNSMRLMVSAVTIPILIINANNSLYGQQHTSNSNYLIVTPDSFRIQAERLAEYRAQGGLSPELIILDTINNAGEESVSDSTLKELITRFWFQNEMEPEYVVLLGDWEIIPPHNDMYMDQLAYSDTWFATDLDGSIGSDSLFLAIGRFPVESNVQLKTYIDRLIRYETQIDILPWENRVLALAGDRNYLTSCIFDFQLSAIGDQIESSGMQFDLISRCVESDAFEPSQTVVFDRFTTGYSVLFYFGFNDQDQWEIDSLFNFNNTSDLDFWQYSPLLLTNGNHQFGYRDTLSSIVKKIMIQNSWGPIAMLSSPNLLGSFQNSAFYQAMLPQIMLNNNTSIGDCFKNTYQNNIPLNAFSYQLFGDPALIPRIVNNEHQIAEPLVLKLSVNDQTIFVSIFPRDSWTKVKLPLSHYTHLFEDTTEILSLEQISLIPYFAQNEFTHGNILIDDFALGELFSQNFEGGLNSLEIQQLQNNLTISLNWDVPGSQGQSLEMTFDRSNSDSLLSSISLFLDPNLELSITDTISFWIKQGEVTLSTDPSGIQTPASFEFAQPYPNPFNASTRLTFSLPSAGIVHFTAYDITGRQVWQMSPQKYSSGVNSFTWQPVNLSSGIYLIRMESGPFVANRKVLMVK